MLNDLNINDLKGNKDLLITSKNIKEKYKKMRRHQQQKINDAETINYVDDLNLNDVKELYELPDNNLPTLELGDKPLNALRK